MQVTITPFDALRLMSQVDMDTPYPVLAAQRAPDRRAEFALAVSADTPDPDLRITLRDDGTWTATCDVYLNE